MVIFRRTKKLGLRRPMWVYTCESSHSGMFIHGTENKAEENRYSLEDMQNGSLDYIGFEKITPGKAILELANTWPEMALEINRRCKRLQQTEQEKGKNPVKTPSHQIDGTVKQ